MHIVSKTFEIKLLRSKCVRIVKCSLASRPAGLRPGPWEMQLSKLASEERRLTMDNTGKVPRNLSSSVPGSDVTG